MRIIQTVVQFSCSQCVKKCRAVFELVSNRVPGHLWFRVILCEFRNQSVKRVDRFRRARNARRNNRFLRLPKSDASMEASGPRWHQSRSNSGPGLRACLCRRHKGRQWRVANPWWNGLRGIATSPAISPDLPPKASLLPRSTSSESRWRKLDKAIVYGYPKLFGLKYRSSFHHCSDDQRKTVFQAWEERVRVDVFLWHRIQKISASTSSGLTRQNSATAGGSAFSQHGECSHESKASHRTGQQLAGANG
jgi:hypothetical protein